MIAKGLAGSSIARIFGTVRSVFNFTAASSDCAEDAILDAARAIQKQLPEGSVLREVRPDLVSLADVAKRLDVTRQSLQKRKMSPASQGGLFRMEEVAVVVMDAAEGKGAGSRKGRFAVDKARKWLSAGQPARRVNAGLAVGAIDGATLEVRQDAKHFFLCASTIAIVANLIGLRQTDCQQLQERAEILSAKCFFQSR